MMEVEVVPPLPPNAAVTVGGSSIPCDGQPHTGTVQIAVNPGAPFEPFTYDLQATSPTGETCSATGTANVEPITDLDVDSNNDGMIDPDNSPMGMDDPIETTAPGKWLHMNNDDSDGNGTPDNAGADADIINTVDDATEDLVAVWVRGIDPSTHPPDAQLFLEISTTTLVRVFNGNFTFSVPILGPGLATSFKITPIPTTDLCLGVEGLAFGTVTLALVLRDPRGTELCRDDIMLTAIQLDVQWHILLPGVNLPGNEIVDPNAPIANDPNNPANVGVRCFPGAFVQTGTWLKTVAVVVQTQPPVAGVPVSIAAFDVDDPSDDDAPVDSNDEDGPNGSDNRDLTGGGVLASAMGVTGADGSFFSPFTVYVQPGDNHRVAATMKPSALTPLTENVIPPPPRPSSTTTHQVLRNSAGT